MLDLRLHGGCDRGVALAWAGGAVLYLIRGHNSLITGTKEQVRASQSAKS